MVETLRHAMPKIDGWSKSMVELGRVFQPATPNYNDSLTSSHI